MARLTREKTTGSGYLSKAKKDELIQRLGGIEHGYEKYMEQVCDQLCKHLDTLTEQDELDKHCDRCPLNILENLILEGEK